MKKKTTSFGAPDQQIQIGNHENQPFCEHAMKCVSEPLLKMYMEVYMYKPDETPLGGLPERIRGCLGAATSKLDRCEWQVSGLFVYAILMET